MDVLPPTGTYLAFVAAAGAIVLMPGPDTVTVLSQGATRGSRSGLATALGVSTGVLVHTAAVALGLAALLSAAPAAFTAIQVVGAVYLVYLGVQTLRSDDVIADRQPPASNAGAPFRAGFVVNATNPKVAIFFLAFLPAFTAGGPDTGIQLVALGATYSLLSGLYLGTVGATAGRVRTLLESPRALRGLRLASGIALLALAGFVAKGAIP